MTDIKRTGPLIRIGPNELSFYSIDIYETIHSIRSSFVKDPRVYGQFVQDAHPALFSITYVIECYLFPLLDNLTKSRQRPIRTFPETSINGATI